MHLCNSFGASRVALVIKHLPVNAGDLRDRGSTSGSGGYPGGGHGNPPQYSCLENPMNRGAWRTIVHRVANSQTWLKRISMNTWDLFSSFITFIFTLSCLFFSDLLFAFLSGSIFFQFTSFSKLSANILGSLPLKKFVLLS